MRENHETSEPPTYLGARAELVSYLHATPAPKVAGGPRRAYVYPGTSSCKVQSLQDA
jgi:hypothetical protein